MKPGGRYILAVSLVLSTAVVSWAVDIDGTGSPYTRAAWDALYNAGDSLVITGDSVLNMNDATDTKAIGSLTVDSGVTFTISFAGGGSVILDDNCLIIVNGTMTVSGSGGVLDFSGNGPGSTLTIQGTIGGASDGNTILVGNNTLRTSIISPSALHTVSLGGANATLDIDTTTTIATLTLTGAVNITPADTQVLTITNAVLIGPNKLTCTGSGGGGAEPIHATFALNKAAAEVETDGADEDDILGDVTINASVDGATLDVNFDTSATAVNLSNDLSLEIADTKTLTTTVDLNANTLTFPATSTGTVSTVQADTDGGAVQANGNAIVSTFSQNADAGIGIGDGVNFTITNAFTTGGNKLTLSGSNGGGQDTFTATVQLNHADAELEIGGADADNVKGFNVTATADGATLDVNANASPAAVTQNVGTGDLTLTVAAGKTLTTTVDVNDNTLTLTETGTITTVKLDTEGGTVQADANGTISTLTHTASRVKLGDGVNFTITNAVSVGAANLTIEGSGGNNQETLNATLNLNNADSVVTLAGDSADNLKGLIINMSTAGSTLDVNAGASPTDVVVTADAQIDVAASQTLTADIDFSTHTLTTSGAGAFTQLRGTTGTLNANGTNSIATLTANPGSDETFTIGGSGQTTIGTFTPLNADGEKLAKMGTGSITLTNGFSFASGTGIQLLVNQGSLTDAGAAEVTFGDDAEKILVSSGASFTTSSDYTGQSGSEPNLDAVAGSTVTFTKTGVQRLTSTADNDFKLLGTVNIDDGTTLTMGGAFAVQFGNVNVSDTAALVDTVGNSAMLFSPDATVALLGTSSGRLTIDGQSTTTRISLNTTTGTGQWTLDRGASKNVTIRNASIANMIYTSNDGGTLESEVNLSGVVDAGGNDNAFSDVVANAGPDREIIAGNSTTLSGSASGGSGSYTFAWTPTTGLDDATSATPTASPTETTTYTLTVTDSTNTSKTATDTVVVTVTPALTVSAGEDKTVVEGESVQLDGSAIGGSGEFTYAWTPATGLDNASSPTPIATPTTTTTYTLTVTDTGDNNRTATDSVVVTVTPAGGISGCGAGLCGAGSAMMVPVMICGMLVIRRRNHRW